MKAKYTIGKLHQSERHKIVFCILLIVFSYIWDRILETLSLLWLIKTLKAIQPLIQYYYMACNY